MYCRNCGGQLNDNQAVCLKCGVSVGDGKGFCHVCGQPVNENAEFCMGCGCAVRPAPKPTDNKNDAPNTGFMVLGFFFPLIGLILYLIYHDNAPLKAKSAGKGALIGVIASVALTVIITVLYAIMLGALIGGFAFYDASMYF
ncbi:MAG: zinc ribbon domain-containing protein [Clostridia bacterium]|nr:zinc ribbon domain-containing protein [Clostridia bacterium]